MRQIMTYHSPGQDYDIDIIIDTDQSAVSIVGPYVEYQLDGCDLHTQAGFLKEAEEAFRKTRLECLPEPELIHILDEYPYNRWCPFCHVQMSIISTEEVKDPRTGTMMTKISWGCSSECHKHV
jgi:hypothetical protein